MDNIFPGADIVNNAMKEFSEILEILIGNNTIPKELTDSQSKLPTNKEPKTGREHLIKYLNQILLRDISDEEREKVVGDKKYDHYIANIHLSAAVEMEDPIAQLILANKKNTERETDEECYEVANLYLKGINKWLLYDSEFQLPMGFPLFQPVTYGYAHKNAIPFLKQKLNYLTQSIQNIIQYETISSTEMIYLGKLLYRLGYKGKEIYDLFTKAGEMGNNDGTVLAGILTELGIGVPINKTKAAEIYYETLNTSKLANTRLGLIYQQVDSPIGFSLEETVSNLKEGALNGHIDSFYHLMNLYNKPLTPFYNQSLSRYYSKQILINGLNHEQGSYSLAFSLFENSSIITCPFGISLFHQMIFKSNLQFQILNDLADRYYNNNMYHPALMIYQFLSELGFVNAQLNAAFMLEAGQGCQNVSYKLRMLKALHLYETIFLGKNNNLLWTLFMKEIPGLSGVEAGKIGDYYYYGIENVPVLEKAIEWYLIATSSNHPNGWFKLGIIKQYIDKDNKYKLNSPDYYYNHLMNITGYHTLGYMLHLNYVIESKLLQYQPFIIAFFVITSFLFLLKKFFIPNDFIKTLEETN
ncbi:hypothetical protein EHI8A_086690 [Entamoeba histolytica HM-1:IMSS-B]|nr:hypothetical protein EHI8A_086690 [Entamoeba histolytica HM-1:IMSS-B]